MMQVQSIPGLWDILCFWMFTGSGLLGLPPGEMDPALVRAVPPQTLVYFEWAARGPGQPGATGIDGFAADPEIQNLFRNLDATLADFERRDTGPLAKTHREMLQLINPLTAHPGCLFIGFEPQVQNKNGLGIWLDMLKGLNGGIVFSTAADTDSAWQKLISILSTNDRFAYDETSATQAIPVSLPGYQLFVHREPGRIIFALGEGTLQRILDGLTGKVPGLDTNQRFVQSLGKVGVPRVSTVGWIDGKGLIDGATTALGPLGGLIRPILQIVRIDAIDHTIFMSGVENGTMVQRTFINTGGRTDGVLVLMAGQPIRLDQYSHIPADADLVFATSASLSNVFQEARRTLATAQPLSVKVFDEAIKQFEKDLQLRIIDDVLPAFGDVITVFDSPAAGGMIATSLVASVELRDPQRAAVVFDRLVRMIDQSLSRTAADNNANPNGELVAMRRQEFLGYTYFFANGDVGSSPPSVTPALCLTDRHLLIAMHPQALKAELRHLRSNAPGFIPKSPGGAPATPGDVMLYGYLNGPRAYGLAATAAPFIGQDILGHLQQQGWPLDAASIPSSAAVVPYFGDATIVVTRQADGIAVVSKNAPPVLATMGLLGAYREWKSQSPDGMSPPSGIGDEVQFSEPTNQTKTASHEEPAPTAKPTPSPYRKIAPIFFRALVPEGVQQMIPEEAIQAIENGPTQAQLERREELRKQRELRRQELRRRRGGAAPAPVPAPQPSQP